MSILNDKTFDNMDWISQAVEPYHCEINDVLARMPEEQVLPVELIYRCVSNLYDHSLSIDTILKQQAEIYDFKNLDYDERNYLSLCFALVPNGPISINASNKTMTGEIKLVKTANIIEDKHVISLIKESLHLRIAHKHTVREAVRDLANLILTDPAEIARFKQAPPKTMFSIVSRAISRGGEEDLFKFRSVKASRDFAEVVKTYLTTNGPKELGIIYRIIMMSRRGQVIYSLGD